eukprot:bmy_13330T0
MSQARTPKAPSFSQKNHSSETCSLVLRSIFHLAECEETQHSQKVFGCRICLKRFHFSANLQKHQKQHMEEKSFSNTAFRALFVKSCKCHVSRKPFTCEEVGKDFLATLGHLQPQTTHTRGSQTRLPSVRQLYKAEKVITAGENARKPSAGNMQLFRTRVSTLEDTVLCAVNVGKHSEWAGGVVLAIKLCPSISRFREFYDNIENVQDLGV